MTVAPAPARIVLTWVGRAGAGLAVFSAVLHAASLGHMAHQGGALAAALMIVMIGGCLYCAKHLWTRAGPSDWSTVAAMSLMMIALHAAPTSARHAHSTSPALAANLAEIPTMPTMPLMTLAVLAAVTEAAIATIALVVTTNLRNRCLFEAS